MINKREIANDLVTLRDLIRWGTSQFNAADLCFAQGMPTAIDEAVYLCLSALHLPPGFQCGLFRLRAYDGRAIERAEFIRSTYRTAKTSILYYQ